MLGPPKRRSLKTNQKVKELAAKYEAEGLSPDEALARAEAEAGETPTGGANGTG